MASTAALELVIKLDDQASKGMDGLAKKGGMLENAMGFAAGGAILGGLEALGGGLLNATQAAAEEQAGMDRLQKTLQNSVQGYNEATGGVEDYIAQQQKMAFADDELRDSLGFLVGQTKNLKEAQELQATAMDLARAKGISLEQATKAVGKVDQESLGILKKLGIQVTDNMSKEDALRAIREQTAGQAAAFASGPAGQMEIAMNKIGDAVEDVGAIAMPILSIAIGALQGALDVLLPVITGVFQFLADNPAVLTGIAIVITGMLVPAFIAWGTTMLTVTLPALIATMAPIIAAAAPFIALGALVAGLWMAFDSNFLGIRDIVTGVWDVVSGIFQNIIGFFTEAIPQIPAKLGELAAAVITWITDTATAIGTAIASWATAFWTWVTDVVTNLGTNIAAIWTAVSDWITSTAGSIGSAVASWATAFWGWITTVVGAIGGKLGEIASAIWGWISSTATGIGTAVAQFAGAFWTWITDVIGAIGGKLGDIASSIWDWITTTATGIGVAVAQFAGAFWNWITDVVTNIGTKLGQIWDAISKWVTDTAAAVYEAAKAIGEGIVNGIKAGWDWLWGNTREGVRTDITDMTDKIMQDLGEHSPSTVYNDIAQNMLKGMQAGFVVQKAQTIIDIGLVASAIITATNTALGTTGGPSTVFATIGQNLMAGLQQGINNNANLAITAVTTAAGKLLPAAKNNLGDFSTIGTAISAGVNAGINASWGGVVANIMQKARTLASAARQALDIHSPSKPFVQIGNIIMGSVGVGIEEGAPAAEAALRGAMGHLISLIPEDDLIAAATSGSKPFLGGHLTDLLPEEDQQAAVSSWQDDFEEMYRNLYGCVTDPITALADKWEQDHAANPGEQVLAPLMSEITVGGPLVQEQLTTQMEALLPAAMTALGDWKTVGTAIDDGITAGINAGWDAVVTNLMDKVKALMDQAKAALEIHSPSGVFERIGQEMMAGWAIGIAKGGNMVLGAMQGVLGGVIPRGGFGTMPVLNPGGWSVANGSAAGGDGGFGTMPVRNAGGYTINVYAGIGTDGRSVGRHVVDVLNEELGLDRRATSWVKKA